MTNPATTTQRTYRLIVAHIDSCKNRLVLLDENPILKEDVAISQRAAMLSDLQGRLVVRKIQIDSGRTVVIEDDLDLLESSATQVSMFDTLVMKSEWGARNFARIKKHWRQEWMRNHGSK